MWKLIRITFEDEFKNSVFFRVCVYIKSQVDFVARRGMNTRQTFKKTFNFFRSLLQQNKTTDKHFQVKRQIVFDDNYLLKLLKKILILIGSKVQLCTLKSYFWINPLFSEDDQKMSETIEQNNFWGKHCW